MPTIRVDEEVFEVLGRQAVPFIDKTPNDVLRRILLTAPPVETQQRVTSDSSSFQIKTRRRRPRTPDSTPKQIYRRPILEILVEAGGKAGARDVLEALGNRIQLKTGDFENISSGEVRWENRAKWSRKDLAMEGLLNSDSPRGLWEITDEGRRRLSQGNV